MRNSLYWDDFRQRAEETVSAVQQGISPPVRRVAVFITDKCNLACAYCNHNHGFSELSESAFHEIVRGYGDTAILHITGGEPSTVAWLYPYLREHGGRYRFHLNTNAVLPPPATSVRRLKVSLDSCDAAYWNALVGRDVFDRVVKNIQAAIPHTVVSITYTMTRENFRAIPGFIRFAQQEFPGVYALFFSVYKGSDRRFAFGPSEADEFFVKIKPRMESLLDPESRALLVETLAEKRRIMQGERFPENRTGRCWLSLSERVFLANGAMSYCSHLVRDGISLGSADKHDKCCYGCNRRLVAFNEYVQDALVNAEAAPPK
jgi:MoaA/NifB/PqqE/SkfB family radical SAM enzyme